MYSVEQSGMRASELGEAILGMSQCLYEAGHVALLNFDDIYVLPIEHGSVKTIFIFIRNQQGISRWDIVVGLGVLFALINDGFSIIERFGANQVRQQSFEVIQAINDERVLKLCQSSSFRNGAKDVAHPLSEVNEKVTIKYGEKSFEIICDNKYQFYESDNQEILPELTDGQEVTLHGEITRINKKTNDLGFVYKGKALSVSPSEPDKSIADYHVFLTAEEVIVRGLVSRVSMFEVPKIKIFDIYTNDENQLPLDFSNQSD